MLKAGDWVMTRKMQADGISISEMARQLGCCRATARKYAKQDVQPVYKRAGRPSKLDPFKPYLRTRLDRAPFSAVRLFEEVKQQGYFGKLTGIKDFVREIKRGHILRAVMRFETLPGQQAQVDWGEFGTIMENGVEKKLYCFFMILGYSRTRFVQFTTNTALPVFFACHMNAFQYLGGVPKEILYDNLKQVVLKRLFKAKESTMNKRFMDFAGHYGFAPILCRPYRPQTKGKVENTVKYVKHDFFLGLDYVDLADLNRQASAWLERKNNEPHGTTKEKPFDRLTQENLTSIDGRPAFDNSEVFYRKASVDCLVCFDGSKYSVPSKYAGREISIKKTPNLPLAFFYRTELVCEHEPAEEKGGLVSKSDHFVGIKELSYKTKKAYRNRYFARQVTEPVVDQRPLSTYDALIGVDINGKP
jgi:transposase